MEFDIVNEIITCSVVNLFQPKFTATQNFFPPGSDALNSSKSGQQQKAQSFTSPSPNTLKTETKKVVTGQQYKSDTQDNLVYKSLDSLHNLQKHVEPPTFSQRSVSTSYEKETNISSSRKGKDSTDSSRAEQLSNTSFQSQESSQNQASKPSNYTIEKWLTKDGPQKLQESLNKLGLNLHNINKINLSGLSVKQLEAEKKNVKHELKRYDGAFVDIFKRMPTREEKEAMRPLYIYYKRIKQFLAKAESEEKDTRTGGGGSKPQSLGNLSMDSDRNSKNVASSQPKMRENKGGSMSYGNISTSVKKIDSSFEEQLSQDNAYDKVYNPVRGNERHDLPIAKKQESRISKEEAQKKLEVLEGIKTQLREKLHAYQVEFTKNNNRKIKYHKDIIPVEQEYKRYKDVKDEIQALEEVLRS